MSRREPRPALNSRRTEPRIGRSSRPTRRNSDARDRLGNSRRISTRLSTRLKRMPSRWNKSLKDRPLDRKETLKRQSITLDREDPLVLADLELLSHSHSHGPFLCL
jgi:hypothetical protein